MRALISIVGALAAAWGIGAVRKSQTVNLRHFTPGEFGAWWPLMNSQLLIMLDEFRERLGWQVIVNREHGLGRRGNETSQHFPGARGVVAVDAGLLVPAGNGQWRKASGADLQRAFEVAKSVGFTGIGVYPAWHTPGVHLDIREGRAPGNPATWAWLGKTDGEGGKIYAGIQQGFA